MRQFLAADDFKMTVLGAQCAVEMSALERRIWPHFRAIRRDMAAAAKARRNG